MAEAACLAGFSARTSFVGGSLRPASTSACAPRAGSRSGLVMRAATQTGGGGTVKKTVGTKKVKVPPVGEKLRGKTTGGSNVKLLSRIEQLRLLSKAEKAGLLSAAEKFGFTLSSIEKLGLLSKAEELGVLSAATDPATPRALFTAALALLVAGPVFVYLVPEDSTLLVVLQYAVAVLSVLGGSAAFAASNFVSTLQSAE